MIFQQKCFSCYILLTDQIFIVWLSLLFEILGNMCIAIVFWPGCDVINFEINLIFLIKPFLCMIRKSKQKLKYLENEKRVSSVLKDFHLLKIVSHLRVRLHVEVIKTWKQKKMEKAYARWWTLGWGIGDVSLPLWKMKYRIQRKGLGRKCLENSGAVLNSIFKKETKPYFEWPYNFLAYFR